MVKETVYPANFFEKIYIQEDNGSKAFNVIHLYFMYSNLQLALAHPHNTVSL